MNLSDIHANGSALNENELLTHTVCNNVGLVSRSFNNSTEWVLSIRFLTPVCISKHKIFKQLLSSTLF